MKSLVQQIFASAVRLMPQRLLGRFYYEAARHSDECLRQGLKLPHAPECLACRRFDAPDVDVAVGIMRRRFPTAPMFLLTDVDDKQFAWNRELERGPFSPAHPRQGPVIFVCAFDDDEKLVEAIDWVRTIPEAYYICPQRNRPVARYFHRHAEARRVLLESTRLGRFDLADFETIIQALDVTRGVAGAYVEIGVYRGDSAFVALNYMQTAGIARPSYFFDTFEGFAYEAAGLSQDAAWLGTHEIAPLEAARKLLGRFADCHVERLNIITQDLPAEIGPIAVANVDVDMYEAVAVALDKVVPHIPIGGLIIVEDQGHTPQLAGAYLASKEFLATDRAADFLPWQMASGQMILFRIKRSD
ncbi:MAG TPA: TylF/MycF/NovP-related O-methyltransferase [Pirellulales bacterium]|jgi:hypothetical protein|nr:TylF/MycF/NovP-related O-methyltransferase [Pirellulales bacterium]